MRNDVPSPRPSRVRRGFTLIELLVVISIIVILAGIAIGVSGWVGRTQDEKLTRVRLQSTNLRIEEYANDNNGTYPVGPDSTSTILYKVLSGDLTGQGNNPTQPIYWPELNDDRNASLVGIFRQNRVILDGFGQSYRYRAAKDENGNPMPNVRNDGAYDLWSIGPDGLPLDPNAPGNQNNEENQDDIWK